MRIAGIVGWHDSGKTTLITTLVNALVDRGYRVSTIKHAHHGFDVDTPGKDSWKHRASGATEVMVASSARWALMHELRTENEPALAELLAAMSPVDLVLVEGFKHEKHDKIEVYRAGLADRPIALLDPTVVALADDGKTKNVPDRVKHLDAADPASIADFIEHHWGLERPRKRRA
ncbi:MAG: molybdopterin-guanine dinucleotide biosynthesis protein B [Alphaproteobacteria bacterium]|nr:molybdopterin-guanine dinucleotide biosynthesis protein B [Alphaproteobacteria bacterium]